MAINFERLDELVKLNVSGKVIYVIGTMTRGLGEAEELRVRYPGQRFEFYGDYDFLPFGFEDMRQLSTKALEKLDYVIAADAFALVIASDNVSHNFGYKIRVKLDGIEVVTPNFTTNLQAPIVVIDSGVGGLNIVAELAKLKPSENFIFISDNEFMPYGTKDERIVSRRIIKIIAAVKKMGPKAVVLACNTLDSVAGDKISAQLGGIKLIRIVGPTAKKALKISNSKVIGLAATVNTVNSQKYMMEMLGLSPNTHLIGLECPKLASAIEFDEEVKVVTREELEPLIEFNVDTLILGCTHYYKVLPIIKKMYPGVSIVDSNQVIIEHTIEVLENSLPFNVADLGSLTILTTKRCDSFENHLARVLDGLVYEVREFTV